MSSTSTPLSPPKNLESRIPAEPLEKPKKRKSLEFPNAVVLNAVVRRIARVSANERVRKSANERKRAQKGAKERCFQLGVFEWVVFGGGLISLYSSGVNSANSV